MKRKIHAKNTLSVLLTVSVVLLLILAGPISGITVYLTPPVSTNTLSETAVFQVEADWLDGESIPVSTFTLTITGGKNKTCVFYPNGSEVSGCSNIVIGAINTQTSSYVTDAGYGYGYAANDSTYSFQNVTFDDDGYQFASQNGYGYDNSNGSEFKYNVTWAVFNDSAPSGSYTTALVLTTGSSDGYLYTHNNSETFTVSVATAVVPPAVNLSDNTTRFTGVIAQRLANITNLRFNVTAAVVYGASPPSTTQTLNTTQSAVVLDYFEINISNTTWTGSATITFKMNNETLVAAGLAASDVALWVRNDTSGIWTNLTTSVVSSTVDPLVFSAVTTHFSLFAVGQKPASPTPTNPTSTGGSSGSSYISAKKTYDASNGGTFTMKRGDKATFGTHTFTLKIIKADYVSGTWESTPIDITVKSGESVATDFEGDGQNDVTVMLKSVSADKASADLTFAIVTPSVPEQQPGTTPSETPATAPETVTTPAGGAAQVETVTKTPLYVWIVVVVALVAVIVAGYVAYTRKKQQ